MREMDRRGDRKGAQAAEEGGVRSKQRLLRGLLYLELAWLAVVR